MAHLPICRPPIFLSFTLRAFGAQPLNRSATCNSTQHFSMNTAVRQREILRSFYQTNSIEELLSVSSEALESSSDVLDIETRWGIGCNVHMNRHLSCVMLLVKWSVNHLLL
jgi:hypothetical protein